MAIKRDHERPNIVVLGGGNGTSRLLHALSPLLTNKQIASLYALVVNVDDGGSTGRLRQQYGVAAMGDITNTLVALSGFHGDLRGEQLLKAMTHRFESGDFKGHTVRNILLTALEQTSDLDSGIAMMARILQIPKFAGVVPLTLRALTQQIAVEKGGHTEIIAEGQFNISHNVNLQEGIGVSPDRITVTFTEADPKLNSRAEAALSEADYIIIAPGHTYGTILPTLALPALGRHLAQTSAPLIMVMPLLTTPGHTTGWTGEDFVKAYEKYTGRPIDMIFSNTGTQDMALEEGQEWVRLTRSAGAPHVLEYDFVNSQKQVAVASDVVPRAIAVHNASAISKVFAEQVLSSSPQK